LHVQAPERPGARIEYFAAGDKETEQQPLMTTEERDALLAQPLDAILAAQRPSGGPQLTVIWYYWDGAAFYMSTTRDRSKYANVKRNPEVSLIVNDAAAHKYVAAYGRAEIVEQPIERVAELTRPILEKHMPGGSDSMIASLAEQQRVVIVLRPQKLVTN